MQYGLCYCRRGLLSTFYSFEKLSKGRYVRYTLQLIKIMKSVTSLVLKKASAIVCVFHRKRRLEKRSP